MQHYAEVPTVQHYVEVPTVQHYVEVPTVQHYLKVPAAQHYHKVPTAQNLPLITYPIMGSTTSETLLGLPPPLKHSDPPRIKYKAAHASSASQ